MTTRFTTAARGTVLNLQSYTFTRDNNVPTMTPFQSTDNPSIDNIENIYSLAPSSSTATTDTYTSYLPSSTRSCYFTPMPNGHLSFISLSSFINPPSTAVVQLKIPPQTTHALITQCYVIFILLLLLLSILVIVVGFFKSYKIPKFP